MHGLIIYKSKYGSTKQYAEWLREETGFELCDVKQCPANLSAYDTVVIGCSIMAGKLALAGWIRGNWAKLQGKRVFVFFTHITDDNNVLAQVIPGSLSAEIAGQVTGFPVRGWYFLQKMSGTDRFIVNMVAKIVKDPQVKQELVTDADYVKRENLAPIVSAIRQQA